MFTSLGVIENPLNSPFPRADEYKSGIKLCKLSQYLEDVPASTGNRDSLRSDSIKEAFWVYLGIIEVSRLSDRVLKSKI